LLLLDALCFPEGKQKSEEKCRKFEETMGKLYHLESRWLNSHVLVYHSPLLSHLLGVAPSTFQMVYGENIGKH